MVFRKQRNALAPVLCMLSRAARALTRTRSRLFNPPRYGSQNLSGSRPATSNAATLQAIRDGFSEVRGALALVNQGERLSVAQKQISELTKELDVRQLIFGRLLF